MIDHLPSEHPAIPERISNAVVRFGLTPREGELVELLAVGFTTTAVCEELRISEATIRTHLRKIFSALNIESRVQLVAMVLNQVLVDIGEVSHLPLMTRLHATAAIEA